MSSPLINRQAAEFLYAAGVYDRYSDLDLFRRVAEAMDASDRDGFGDPGSRDRISEFRQALEMLATELGVDVGVPVELEGDVPQPQPRAVAV